MKSLYLHKIQEIQESLQSFGYRSKFQELTQSNVFNFDINQIISDKNQHIIVRLCKNFFYFLILKLILRLFQQNQYSSTKDIAQLTKSKKSLFRANSIQKIGINAQQVIFKSRAATTLKDSTILHKKTLKKLDKNINIQQKISKNKNQIQGYCYQKQKVSLSTCSFGQVEDQRKMIISMLSKKNQNVKQAYYSLTQFFNNKNRVFKLEIVSFLIAMISPQVLHHFVQKIEKQFVVLKTQTLKPALRVEEQIQNCVQQEIYIILTYQTLGNLISESVFKCLKKKYIKQIIFNYQGDKGYYKLVRSLKHIKERLAQKDVIIIKGRRQMLLQKQKLLKKKNSLYLDENKGFSKQRIKKLIKQTLKTKQQIDYTSINKINNNEYDEFSKINQKIKQSFYPSFAQTTKLQISIPKQNLNLKCSTSMKSKLNQTTFKVVNTKEDRVRKKYIQNFQNTFYKIKQKNELQESKPIKSQRSSCKFSKISLQDQQSAVQKTKNEKQPIQQIKIKICMFKEKAMKDLVEISQCNPSLLHKNLKKYKKIQQYKHVFDTDFSKNIQRIQKFSSEQSIVNKIHPQKQLQISLNTQKGEAWHQLYDIKTQPIINYISAQKPRFQYKLTKKSDKLKKGREDFLNNCKQREQFLQEQSGLIQKMQLNLR